MRCASGSNQPVVAHAELRVALELDSAVLLAGGRGQDLHDEQRRSFDRRAFRVCFRVRVSSRPKGGPPSSSALAVRGRAPGRSHLPAQPQNNRALRGRSAALSHDRLHIVLPVVGAEPTGAGSHAVTTLAGARAEWADPDWWLRFARGPPHREDKPGTVLPPRRDPSPVARSPQVLDLMRVGPRHSSSRAPLDVPRIPLPSARGAVWPGLPKATSG